MKVLKMTLCILNCLAYTKTAWKTCKNNIFSAISSGLFDFRVNVYLYPRIFWTFVKRPYQLLSMTSLRSTSVFSSRVAMSRHDHVDYETFPVDKIGGPLENMS